MKIFRQDIKRNALRILIVAAIAIAVSGGAGMLISVLTDRDVNGSKIVGWALLGIILFGMPLAMFLLLPRQPRKTRTPRPH
jgi:hypothetical protein